MSQTLLTIASAGRTWEAPLEARGLVIGRDPACGLPLDDPLVSREHARIFQDPFRRWIVEDLGSRNGVWAGGRQVRAHAIAPGERIEIGSHSLWLEGEGGRQIEPDPRTAQGVSVEVDPAATQMSAAPRGAPREALSEMRFRQLSRLAEALSVLTAPAELYPAVRDVLAEEAESAAVVLRLPPAESAGPLVPAVLACRAGGAGGGGPRPGAQALGPAGGAAQAPLNLHLSRRVLESVRSGGQAVLAGQFRGRLAGAHLDLTVADADRPRAVCCAPIAGGADGMDALYLDLPAEAGAADLLDFTQAAARQAAMARRSLLLAEERAERVALDHQLAMAREIQAKLTPPASACWPGVEVAVYYQPALWVGGDYCDVWTLDDGRLAFALGDVSGKGLPAALVMTNLQAALRTTLSFCRDLADVAARLSRHLETHLPEGLFVTLVLGLLDPAGGDLQCVNAGHLLPLVPEPGGGVSPLGKPRNPPLGVAPGHFEVERVRLPPGGGLVVVTDGITECLSPAGEEFGEESLRSAVAAAPPGGQSLLQAVVEAASDFRQTQPQRDDATVLAIVRT